MDKATMKKQILYLMSLHLANLMPDDLILGGAETPAAQRRFNDAKTDLLRELDRRMGAQ